MIIGPSQLNHLVQFHGLVSPLEDEIKLNTIDLSLGRVWEHNGGARLISNNDRYIGDRNELELNDNGLWLLRPFTKYLACSIEEVAMPSYMAALCLTRSTPFRAGIIVTSGFIDPAYTGKVHFCFTTPGPRETEIAYGFPMVQLAFFAAEPTIYRGVYNGGKTQPKEI